MSGWLGNHRRVLRSTLSVALCVVIAALGSMPVQQANAFTPVTNLEPAVGSSAEVSIVTELTHNKISDATADTGVRDPKQGETFTYTGSWAFSGMNEAGVAYSVKLYVTPSQSAPFTSNVTLSDFTSIPSNWSIQSLQWDNASGSWVLTAAVTGATDGSATIGFSKQATVSTALTDGQYINATISAEVTSEGTPVLTEGTPKYFAADPEDPCSGTFTFTWKLSSSGAWLADIKLADAEGKGKLTIDSNAFATSGTSTIHVTDANGSDITSSILEKMSYNAEDSTSPYLPSTISVLYPQARWLQSANWEVDTAAYTGTTWLPSGSEVTITKYGTHQLCVAGFAVDWDTTRPLEAALEVVRPILTSEDSASDIFATPGRTDGYLACEKNMWYALSNTAAKQGFGWPLGYIDDYTIDTSTPTAEYGFPGLDAQNKAAKVDSTALTSYFPDRVYYIASTANINSSYKGLMYWESTTKTYHKVNETSKLVSYKAHMYGMAFDPDGVLWTVEQVSYNNPDPHYYRLITADGNTDPAAIREAMANDQEMKWQDMGRFPVDNSGKSVHDIIFDQFGNVYGVSYGDEALEWFFGSFLGLFNIATGDGAIYRFLKEDFYSTDPNSLPQKVRDRDIAAVMPGMSDFYGIGWGEDGYIYAIQDKGTPRLWRIPPNLYGDEIILDEDKDSEIINTGDLNEYGYLNKYGKKAGMLFSTIGTCDFGPIFSVDKAAVDPVTGKLAEAGQATSNAISFNSSSEGTITYQVNVHNLNSMAVSPHDYIYVQDSYPSYKVITSWITDDISVPSGFTVTSVTVDNMKITWSESNYSITCPTGYQLKTLADPRDASSSVYTCTSTTADKSDPDGILVKPISPTQVEYTAVVTNDDGSSGETITEFGVASHRISVGVRANTESVDWSQASTCGTMDGSYGGGFYNHITMNRDDDGDDNNDACVPANYTPPTSTLKLVKNIVTADGQPDVANADTAQYFSLRAYSTSSHTTLEGSSPSSGEVAVNSKVYAGSYVLTEGLSEAGYGFDSDGNAVVGDNYTFGNEWTCTDKDGEAKTLTETLVGYVVTVGENGAEEVTCTISNSKTNKAFHVLKQAADPDQDTYGSDVNVVGKAVKAGLNSVYTLEYRIDVVNDSDSALDTGTISDHFVIPDGLVWASDKKATVIFNENGTGATIDASTVQEFSESEFVSTSWDSGTGVKLTDAIHNLPAESTVSFTVTIPLTRDQTRVGNATTFDLHRENLETCDIQTTNGTWVQPGKGVVNQVIADGEDQTYSEIASEDNFACIPLEPPTSVIVPPLPLSGGAATILYTVLGSLLVGGAGGLIWLNRMRQRRRFALQAATPSLGAYVPRRCL